MDQKETLLAVINAAPLTLNSERCCVLCMTLRRRKARAHFLLSRWETLRLSLKLSPGDVGTRVFPFCTHAKELWPGCEGLETERGLRWPCQISSGRQRYNTTCQYSKLGAAREEF